MKKEKNMKNRIFLIVTALVSILLFSGSDIKNPQSESIKSDAEMIFALAIVGNQ